MAEPRWRKHRRCHAKVRAAERYGLHLTDQDLACICGMIRNRRTERVQRISHTKGVHLVEVRGARVLVVYSYRHHEVVTFLPPGQEVKE